MDQNHPFTITTQINGTDTTWVTVVENGVPSWIRMREQEKTLLWNAVQSLFSRARQEGDEEPTVEIITEQRTFSITFFEYGTLYLSDALEKRYGKLSELFDDLWETLENKKIVKLRRF